VLLLQSCKKDEIPTLSTTSISSITATSASSGGNITSDGGAVVSARGVCWSISTNPTTSNSKTVDGNGNGQFTSNLSGLAAGSTYHVRAYAANSVGTAYGADLSFVTLGKAPECITQSATNITSSGSSLNGTVNANYLSTTVTFEYGATTSYGQTVLANQSPVTGNSITNVSAIIASLTTGTTYHFRVMATNSLGTTNGNDLSFTTNYDLPILSTTSISEISTRGAKSGGSISSVGGTPVIARGVCWSINSDPTNNDSKTIDGSGGGSYASSLVGLSPNTNYFVRAYATNSAGTSYGNQLSFQTLTIPVYQSSIIGNSTPSIIELTYDLPFANIIPSTAAFTVFINSVERPVSSIAISGSKILLTLSSPALYGDIVTIAYSEPSTNPIQTTSGGHADSFGAKSVTNNISPPKPTYINSVIENVAPTRIEITFSLTLTNIVPATSAFTVKVNAVNRTVSSISILGAKVLLTLSNPIVYGDIITVAYTKPATNPLQTAYGGQADSFNEKDVVNNVIPAGTGIIFNPNLTYGTVADVEGHTYKTIQIGTQTWMAENLKTAKYNDGSTIPNVTGSNEWGNLVVYSGSSYEATGAFCWYNNDAVNYDKDYGKLYNFGAVESNKLCPTGWHVPKSSEWRTLVNPYIPYNPYDPSDVAGNELMEIGTNHWTQVLGTNETGFTALPGGQRSASEFYSIGAKGYYWTSNSAWGSYGTSAYFYPIPFGGGFGQTPSSTFLSMVDGLSVRCLKDKPLSSITTIEASEVTYNAALSGGIIPDEGGAEATVINRGVCWSTNPNPTISDNHTSNGTGSGYFGSRLESLSQNTQYYIRAFAINTLGTVIYGNEFSFTTLIIEPIVFNPGSSYGTITDIDGNTYKTILIGTQTWMAENLKTTKYNDNIPISNVTDNSAWANLSTGAFCWYFNNASMFKPVYGALYNWYATTNGKLCPSGWHVPSDSEWHTLVLTLDAAGQNILGTESTIAGGKLKETGTRHWQSPNTGATNERGFTAVPGGLRVASGEFHQGYIDGYAYYWTTTDLNSANAYEREIFYNVPFLYRSSGSKVVGSSVRCLKD
jgi:uncharacterized protein (TIGR02145 family)/uncharacterized repeat protein (TIGR02059 family)